MKNVFPEYSLHISTLNYEQALSGIQQMADGGKTIFNSFNGSACKDFCDQGSGRAEFSGQNVVPQIFSERCKLLEGSSHPEFHKELPLPRACLRARLLIAHSRHLVLRCYTDCVHKPSGCMQTSNSWILLFVTPFFPLASQCQGWRKNMK